MARKPQPHKPADASTPAADFSTTHSAPSEPDAAKAGAVDDQPAAGAGAHAPATDANAPGASLVVVAKQPQRWRAGRLFGREETTIPLAALSAAEIAAIESDPLLETRRGAAPARD